MPVVPLPAAKLLFTAVSGPLRGVTYGIAGTTRVGREHPDTDIDLDDPTVSRAHLEIRWRGGQVRCRNLANTNRSRLTFGALKFPCPRAWFPLPRLARLEIGSSTFTITRPPKPRPARRLLSGRSLLPLAAMIIMSAAMIPLAATGPAWRWSFVLLPLLSGAGFLAAGTRKTSRQALPGLDPADILLQAARGAGGGKAATLPTRRLRRTELEGSTWHAPEAEAMWLAGFLATHNAPTTLRVESPWLTTDGEGTCVRFACSGRSDPEGALVLVTADPPRWSRPLNLPRAASAAWMRQLCALLEEDSGSLPSLLRFDARVLEHASLARAARAERACLRVPIGASESGPVFLDLETDGPHAMVAGTTGAGKSELLTSWLLALAARNAPTHLHLVLVDFKGGAAFGPLAGLPHAVSVLTDLNPGATRRALSSIQAMLRERERILAAAGVRDVNEYGSALPRLLIVVDEFRALADDHPEILSQLLRLGSQGRSLGVHLLLATQRPAGAVGPDLRANMGLRIALRVTETADSLDVLGSAAAAALPPVPGRAILRAGRTTEFQVAWAGELEAVKRAVSALAAHFETRPDLPWLPELPEHLPPDLLPPGTVGLVDEPEQLRHSPLPPPRGHAIVVGAARSGRTTAALAFAAATLRSGLAVWVISAAARGAPPPHGRWGGVTPAREVRLVAEILAHVSESTGRVAIFDDTDLWAGLYDELHGVGAASAFLAGRLRAAAAVGSQFFLAGGAEQLTARGMSAIGDRYVLAGFDPATAALAGVPRDLLPPRLPGRAACLTRGLLVQFAAAQASDLAQIARQLPAHPAAQTFLPLPKARPVPPPRETLHLGYGGRTGELISLPVDQDIVVVGLASEERELAYAVVNQGTGVTLEVTPGQWAAGYSGELGRIREHAALVIVRPDLVGNVTGLQLNEALELGGRGYAALAHRGGLVPFRVASVLEEPGSARIVDVSAGGGRHEKEQGRHRERDRHGPDPPEQAEQSYGGQDQH